MVRRLNPDTRRRSIAEAVLAIAARDGLDAATVRDVAAEAGVSAGMVQHHFRSRDEMLQFACEYMLERTRAQTGDLIMAIPEPRSARAILQAALEEMMPLDETRRTGIRIWMAFLARAVVRPDLEAFMRDMHISTHHFFADTLKQARIQGDVGPHVDVEREAIALFSLADGLVSHVLLDHYTGDEALRAINDQLDRLFQT